MSATDRKKKWTAKIYEPDQKTFTKLAIGQKAWYMMGSYIRTAIVNQLNVQINDSGRYVTYTLNGTSYNEKRVFQTKQALINSLYIEYEAYEKQKDKK